MKFRRILLTNTGSLLLELMVAIAVFSIIIPAAVIISLSNSQSISKLILLRQAIYLSEQLLNNSFSSEIPTASSTDSLIASTAFDYITPCLIKITSRVAPKPSFSGLFSLSVLKEDATTTSGLQDDCEGYPSAYSWASSIPSASFSLSGIINSIDADGNIMAAGGTSLASSSPNLFILDIHSQIPTLVSSLSLPGINSLDLSGNYIYLASQSTTSQLQVVDSSNTNSSILIASSTLPGVGGSFPSGLSIRYYNKRLYVGVHRTAGNEFHIYDVSNPASPRWLGSVELNHNINDIAVHEPYAYLATSGNTSDVIILDISNPASIKKLASLTFAGTEDSVKAFLIGNELYVGRKKTNVASEPNLIVVDISSSTQPSVIRSTTVAGDVTGINVTNQTIFVTTTKNSFILPYDLTVIRTLNISGIAQDMQDTNWYIAGSSTLQIINP